MPINAELRTRRKELIHQIEDERKSKILVYFLGDRPNIPANMASDAVRWIYDHLLNINEGNKVNQIDLFLYSVGGNLDAPWQIITTLREFCNNLHVLIPYKAYSAATLLSLGADKILMGKKSELGPIDPQMVAQHHSSKGSQPITSPFSVEDITSYISFLRDKVGLTDQRALYELTKTLAETLSPAVLGQVNRTHSHIRLVARKMLSLVKPPLENVLINNVVESLTEKIYVHGHTIGREEAKQIGIQVENMDSNIEKLCWQLYLEYENLTKLNSLANPNAYFRNDSDEYAEQDVIIACIESMNRYHECSGTFSLQRKREFPQAVNLNLNVPIQLPPSLNIQQLPQQIQQTCSQILQDFQNTMVLQIRNIINEQLKSQSRIAGIDVTASDIVWKELAV